MRQRFLIMGLEIERKFLVSNDQWRQGAVGEPFAQGYLSRSGGRTVRVRITGSGAFLTIKGPVSGITRLEFEYAIPIKEAREILALCEGPVITKNRFLIPFEGHVWEVDDFHGENQGLVIAEVELQDPDEAITLPTWLGREVTGDPRYYNSNLTIHPYRDWVNGTA